MPVVEHDLSRYADILGDPAAHFVDEHDHVWRVVEHATGAVKFVLRPDGTLAAFRPVPNPSAPPVVATLNVTSDAATFKAS